jgi:hypothetical protein
MDAASRYANLRTHSEFTAIRELGGRVVQKYCAIDVSEKTRRRIIVIGNNALGVTGSIETNMFHCLLNVIDDPD